MAHHNSNCTFAMLHERDRLKQDRGKHTQWLDWLWFLDYILHLVI